MIKLADLLIGTGLTVGASIGLAIVAARKGAVLVQDAVSHIPENPASSASRRAKQVVSDFLSDNLMPELISKGMAKLYPSIKAKGAKSKASTTESSKATAQTQSQELLDAESAEKLKETLSAKPSINKDDQTHPYSSTLQNPAGFRPTGAGGGAV